jgi:hypothetical protein
MKYEQWLNNTARFVVMTGYLPAGFFELLPYLCRLTMDICPDTRDEWYAAQSLMQVDVNPLGFSVIQPH